MKEIHDSGSPVSIGRTKTILIASDSSGNTVGVVSEIVTRASSFAGKERLAVKGPVNFEKRSLQQLSSVIVPIVDRICEHLNVPQLNYEISVTNLGAAAAIGSGVKISGYSADLPLFLSLFSASINIGLSQDVIGTGHIASLDGNIAPVKGIPLKIFSALETPGISRFACPDPEQDKSFKALTPLEYQSVKESLIKHRGEITIQPVRNIFDAVSIFTTDESIVTCSLKTGFFDIDTAGFDLHSPVGRIVAMLGEGNKKRFWDSLERFLFNREFEQARCHLSNYIDFHIHNQIYPKGFGNELQLLLISLPLRHREQKMLFPLLPMDLCIKVSHYAKESDHEDYQKMFEAVSGIGVSKYRETGSETTKILVKDPDDDFLDQITMEINKENLNQKYGRIFDEARGSFIKGPVTVRDGFEFKDAITAFSAHIHRYVNQTVGNLDIEAITSDAIDQVKEAFERMGGYNAALSEGMNGINGGMRIVFDTITDYLKQKAIDKHMNRIFIESIDPLSADDRVKLTEIILKRIGPSIPQALRDIPADKLESQLETVLRYYVDSLDKVINMMRTL